MIKNLKHYQYNFLNKDYCEWLIKLFLDNKEFHDEHGPTNFIYLRNYMEFDPIKKLTGKIAKDCIDNVDEDCFINYHQIVEWKKKSKQEEHFDFDYHPYTSIIYLNDDFDGGETIVGDTCIIPKVGKIVTFEGSKILHKVNPIKNGTRYTLPIWYKIDGF